MDKETKLGIAIIIVLTLLSGVLGHWVIKTIKEYKKTYEFAKNGQIFESDNCYVREVDDNAYCEYKNKIIRVDNYYEINTK